MNSGNKSLIVHTIAVFAGLVAMAFINAERYYNDYHHFGERSVFIEGLSFEETVLFRLDQGQVSRLSEINGDYYDDLLLAYNGNTTEQELEVTVRSLIIERQNKIWMLLREDQKEIWQDSVNKLVNQDQEDGQVVGSCCTAITE